MVVARPAVERRHLHLTGFAALELRGQGATGGPGSGSTATTPWHGSMAGLHHAAGSEYREPVMAAHAEPARRRLAAALAELAEVRLAFLFGSHARGRSRAESDFDIAILVDDEAARADRWLLLRRLAGRLGRAVPSPLLDIVLLNDAPALLRQRILRDGVVLYARAPAERVRFALATIREYQDGAIRRAAFTRRRVERLTVRQPHGGSGDLLAKARGVARLLGQAARLP
jgi:predicted nucleotidyltransferase